MTQNYQSIYSMNPIVNPAKDNERANIDKPIDFSKTSITMKNDTRKLNTNSMAPIIIS